MKAAAAKRSLAPFFVIGSLLLAGNVHRGFCSCIVEELQERQNSNAPVKGYINVVKLQPDEIKERVMCSVIAAVKYDVPANIVLAVAELEDGKPGWFVRNTNGAYDVGPMQFNTGYLAELAKYNITPEDVASAGCYSYELAAWRLRGHLRNDAGDIWTRAANYHSRTPRFNAAYRAKLVRAARKWADWLARRFNTRDVLAAETSASDNKAP